MSNIRKVRVAAKDAYCGAVYLTETDPYIKSKNLQVKFELGILQDVQVVLQAYFELRACNGEVNKVVDVFSQYCPEAVQTAKDFYKERYLDHLAQSNKEFREVFESIVSVLHGASISER